MDLILLVLKPLPGLIEDNDLLATGSVGTVTVFLPKTLGAQALAQLVM